jgi:hypothetical protein
MALFPVAGMKLYIGATMNDSATDFVEADFTGANASPDSWVLVDGWEQMGPIGDGAADIATTLINRGRTVHQKGTADAPTMSNVFAIIAGDAGQTALIAAGQPSNKNNYTFKILGNETGTPSKLYFLGLVMGTPEQGGGANTVRKLAANIQVNSNVVHVAAA